MEWWISWRNHTSLQLYHEKRTELVWHFNWINHSKMAFWCTGGILLSNVNLRGTNSFHPWKKHDNYYYFFHAMSRNNMCLFTFAVVVTGIFGCFFSGITQTPLVQNQRKHSDMQMRKKQLLLFLKHVNNLEDKHQNKKKPHA